ncbi:hypothetical protein CVT26_007287 [Gymnopilus dilepis]|uniref:Uncharacterized protein n=1 Tax=Gymnopilus dilepis TaxID=231916 RepID=A0A409VLV2_9AGAR|nr:hypothetical protein CVT26_007287 [Gymnopilus dilepis]
MKAIAALLSIATLTAYIALSDAYTATVWDLTGCGAVVNDQAIFQITGTDMPKGDTGCIKAVYQKNKKWGSLSIVGCTGSGTTTIYSDTNCTDAVRSFTGDSACETSQAIASFQVTGC